MLWLDMGLGKTVAALTAMLEQRNRLEVYGTLVVAPLRVIQSVWRQESRKWAHLDGQLRYSLVTGTKAERERALFTRADVYLTNFENLRWLAEELERRWLSKGKYLPFNQIIWDEVSKMKNTRVQQGVERGKAALRIMPYVTHSVGLTGTPASNGLLDLFGQFLVVDGGERLGTSYEAYKKRFFYQTDYNGYKWAPLPGAQEEIQRLIGDITLSMRADDYLDLPPFIFNDMYLQLPAALSKQYADMEREMMLSFDSGHSLEIENEASLSNRCLQFANGACYKQPGQPEWESIHDLKLEALSDVVDDANGKPVLVMYQFQHDAAKIMKKFPYARRINSQVSEAEFNEIVAQWNNGELRMLIGHPASIGHGLNIQAGSNVLAWYGIPWSLDLYDQANARLRRQGQTQPVIVNRIMIQDTLDIAVRMSLELKASEEGGMRDAVERYRKSRGSSDQFQPAEAPEFLCLQ